LKTSTAGPVPRARSVLTLARNHVAFILAGILPFAVAVHSWFTAAVISGDDFREVPSRAAYLLHRDFPWPSLWDPTMGVGHPLSFWLPSFPLWAIGGWLAGIGCGWNWIERALWLYPLVVLLAVAPYALCCRIVGSRAAATIATLVFSFNTWTIGLVQRGHIPSLCAYSILPLALLAAYESRSRPVWGALLTSALIAVQSAYDIRYAYMSLVSVAILVGWWIVRRGMTVAVSRSKVAAAVGGWFALGFVTLSTYWIVPAILSARTTLSALTTGAALTTYNSPANLADAATLYFPYYRYVEGTDAFAVTDPSFGFWLITLAVGAGLATTRKHAVAAATATGAVLAIFMIASQHSPLQPIQAFIIQHVPGMIMYRDTSRFYAIVATCYAIGAALLVARIMRNSAEGRHRWAPVATICVAFAYVALMREAYASYRGENFATLPIRVQDVRMANVAQRGPMYSRTLMIPNVSLQVTSTLQHPVIGLGGLMADISLCKETASPLDCIKSPLFPILARTLGIARVVTLDDSTGETYHSFNYPFTENDLLTVLRSRRWLKERQTMGRYVVFDTILPADPLVRAATKSAFLRADRSTLSTIVQTRLWSGDPTVVDLPEIGSDSRSAAAIQTLSDVIPNDIDGIWPVRDTSTIRAQRILRRRTEPYRVVAVDSSGMAKLFSFDQEIDFAHGMLQTNTRSAWRIAAVPDEPTSGDDIVWRGALASMLGEDRSSYSPLTPSQSENPISALPLLYKRLQSHGDVDVRFASDSFAEDDASAALSIFAGGALRLSEYPVLHIAATFPHSPFQVRLRLIVRSVSGGGRWSAYVPLDDSAISWNVNVTRVVQAALDDRWRKLCTRPCVSTGDSGVASLRPLDAIYFNLVGADIVTTLPHASFSTFPGDLQLFGTSLSEMSPFGRAARWEVKTLDPTAFRVDQSQGVRLEGPTSLSGLFVRAFIAKEGDTADDTGAVRLGDVVSLVTNRNEAMQGTVLGATPYAITLAQGSTVISVPRSSIQTYQSVTAARPRSLVLSMRLHDSGVGIVTFDAAADPPFGLLPSLSFEIGRNRRTVPAVDSAAPSQGPVLRNQELNALLHTAPVALAQSAAYPVLGRPTALGTRTPIIAETIQRYTIDVRDVRYAWSIPQSAPLVGITITAFQRPSTQVAARTRFTVRIANVRVVRVDAPVCTISTHAFIDARSVPLTADVCAGSGRSQSVALPSGNHLIRVDDTRGELRGLVMERGTPAVVSADSLGAASFLAPDQLYSRFDGRRSIAAVSELYLPGWFAFEQQSNPRNESGFSAFRSALQAMWGNDRILHFRVNGSTNGWLLEGPPGWIRFVYGPALVAYVCAWITALAFSLVLLLAAMVTVRSRSRGAKPAGYVS